MSACPVFWIGLSCPDGESGFIGGDRLFQVVRAHATDAGGISISQIVLSGGPVFRVTLSRENGQRRLVGSDRLFQIVRSVALTATNIGKCQANQKITLDRVPRDRKRPVRELSLKG